MSARRQVAGKGMAHGSWASEALPLAVRRELLQHELRKFGLRQPGDAAHHPGVQQQQQQLPVAWDRPQAEPQQD